MQKASAKKLFEYGEKIGNKIMEGVLSVMKKPVKETDLNSTSDEAK